MNRKEIVAALFRLQDKGYAALQKKIIPTAGKIIGVRTPDLRNLAKRLSGDEETALFLAALPHEYFDENQLHAFVISLEKDFDKCVRSVEVFSPILTIGRPVTSFLRRPSAKSPRSCCRISVPGSNRISPIPSGLPSGC